MAGSYVLTAHAAAVPGISFVEQVSVNQTATGLVVKTAGGQVVSPTSAVAVSGAGQTFVVAEVDQFGNATAVQPAFTWSTITVPAGAPAPTVAATSTGATLTFYKAGSYGVGVQASTGGNFSASVSMTVAQVLSTIKNVPTAPVSISGTSLQLAVPTFLDQFGNAMAVTPALSWSTSSAPTARRRRPSRPAGALPRSRSRWPAPTR